MRAISIRRVTEQELADMCSFPVGEIAGLNEKVIGAVDENGIVMFVSEKAEFEDIVEFLAHELGHVEFPNWNEQQVQSIAGIAKDALLLARQVEKGDVGWEGQG